jgi:hypothetical protein
MEPCENYPPPYTNKINFKNPVKIELEKQVSILEWLPGIPYRKGIMGAEHVRIEETRMSL